MQKKGFTTILIVDQTPEEVFKAVNNVRGWWSEEIEGSTEQLNEVFKYHHKDVHACKLKLVELVPAKKVVWHVLDNYFNFTKDKTEWIDTKISFEISKKDGGTELVFTHLGLNPEYECYAICCECWEEYIHKSLRGLITAQKGAPNPKENREANNGI